MSAQSLYSIVFERRVYLAITLAVFILDRVSKTIVHRNFVLGESRPVIDGLFDLLYLRNTGVAFGIFSSGNTALQALLLSGLAAAASIVIILYSVRTPAKAVVFQAALALILGGALGNLFDRATLGFVIDFFYLHWNEYYWPAFNVADMAVSAGVGLMILEIVRHEVRDRNPA